MAENTLPLTEPQRQKLSDLLIRKARSLREFGRLLYLAENPSVSSPDSSQVESARKRLERVVNGEQGLTPRTGCAIQTVLGLPDYEALLVSIGASPPRLASGPTADQTAAFRDYLQRVVTDCEMVATRGIIPGKDGEDLRLAHVYVNLETTTTNPAKEQDLPDDRRRLGRHGDEPRRLSALDALFDPKASRVVLIGEPGSGKSTFLQYVSLYLADQLVSANSGASCFAGTSEQLPATLRAQAAVPFRILLGEFAPAANGTSDSVVTFLERWLREKNFDAAASGLRGLLESGQAFVLFDGLDEVPRPRLADVRKSITEFARGGCGQGRIAVTCRVESYRQKEFPIERFPQPHTLAPFTDDLKAAFVRAWYHERADRQREFRGDADKTAASLLVAIRSDRLAEMAGNPFFLTAMAKLHGPDHPLPDTGAALMDALVEGVLKESRRQRDGEQARDSQMEIATLLRDPALGGDGFTLLRQALAAAAYEARTRRSAEEREKDKQDQRRTTTAPLADDLLKRHLRLHDTFPVDALLAALRDRAGILQSRDGAQLGFAYRFEEFLAGCHLTNNDHAWPRNAEGKPQAFHERALALLQQQGDYARQVVLWAAGYNTYVVKQSRGPVRELVSALLPPGSPGKRTPAAVDQLLLAADIAHDVGMANWKNRFVPDVEETVAKLRAGLDAIVVRPNDLALQTRAAAASSRGWLGALPDGIGLDKDGLPKLAWLRVETDKHGFLMGGAGGWQAGEKAFRCSLLNQQTFWISRFPVTVAQYEAFVKVGGYDRDKEEVRGWWSPAGLAWLKEAKTITGPENYAPVFQTPNHPRVGVSWHEAFAFANWLSAQMPAHRELWPEGWEGTTPPAVCLPAEWHWERATRHTDGRAYPWDKDGSAFMPDKNPADIAQRCNMGETGLGHTSAVGLFPSGRAECGADDLIGNVWEWCQSRRREYGPNWEEECRQHGADAPDAKAARVLRGASWFLNDPVNLVASYRNYIHPGNRDNDFGFRLVCVGGFAG